MKTYIFKAELDQEEDGRWSSWVEALPGCAAWGYTEEEALAALRAAAEVYIEDLLESGEALPEEVEVREARVIAVTV
ncbi:MAG: type II toxin-antitoxin system HicB family antitoxin [Dehalococcoidia bacterium]